MNTATPLLASTQVLNIGLAVTSPDGCWLGLLSREQVENVIRCVAGTPGTWLRTEVRQSATEPTAVVSGFVFPLRDEEVFQIAEKLGQDCIAVRDARGGRLIGPRAAAWGPFDPGRFLDPTAWAGPFDPNAAN